MEATKSNNELVRDIGSKDCKTARNMIAMRKILVPSQTLEPSQPSSPIPLHDRSVDAATPKYFPSPRARPNAEATPKKARLRTPIPKDCFNITLDTNNHMSLGIGFPKVIQKWLEVDVLGIGRVGDGRLHFESLYDCINAIEENHEIPERLQTILRDIWIDGNRLRHKESNFLSDPRGYWQKAIEILSFLYPNASIVHEPNLKERRQEERIQELEQKLRRWDQRIEELQQLLADPRGSRDHHGRRSSGGYHGSYSPRCDYNDGNDQCCSIRYRDDVNDHHSHSRSRSRSPKRSRRRS